MHAKYLHLLPFLFQSFFCTRIIEQVHKNIILDISLEANYFFSNMEFMLIPNDGISKTPNFSKYEFQHYSKME